MTRTTRSIVVEAGISRSTRLPLLERSGHQARGDPVRRRGVALAGGVVLLTVGAVGDPPRHCRSCPGAVARLARRVLPGGCGFPRSGELVEAVEIYAPEREHVGDDVVTAMDLPSRARVLGVGRWLGPGSGRLVSRPRCPPRLRGRTRNCLRVRRGRRRGGTRPPRRVATLEMRETWSFAVVWTNTARARSERRR